MGAQTSSSAESETSAVPANVGGQAGAEAQPSASGDPVPVPVVPQQQRQQERQVVLHGPVTLQQIQQLFVTPCRLQLHRCQVPVAPAPAPERNANVNDAAAPASIVNGTNATPSSSEASEDSSHVSEVKEEEDSSYCEEVPSAPSGARKLVEYSDTGSDSSEDDIKVFTASRAIPSSRKQPVPAPSVENHAAASSQSAEETPVDSRPVAASSRKVKWEDSSDPESSSTYSSDDELQSAAASSTAPLSKKRPVATLGSKNDGASRTRPAARRPGGLRMAIKLEDNSDSTTGSGSCSEDDDSVKDVRVLSAGPLAKEKRAVSKEKIGKGVSDRKSSFPCTVCKKIFSSKYNLQRHMAKHSGETPYKCEKCGRSFCHQSYLSNHKKIRDQRNGVCPRESKMYDGSWRPKGSWTCEICRKKMKTSSTYLPHMRIHRGEKPFKCKECGKGFGSRWHLSVHSRIHSGVWQFSCVFCDRGFHFKNHLFNHLRGHTEEKPYFCVVEGCGASFRHLESLKYHRRMIHF